MAGARMLSYYPVSIPYHGQALNITVQSYAGKMYWALTACRRALPQAEAYELIANLELALSEIEKFAAIEDTSPAADVESRSKISAPAKKVAVKAARKSQVVAAAPVRKAKRAGATARAPR